MYSKITNGQFRELMGRIWERSDTMRAEIYWTNSMVSSRLEPMDVQHDTSPEKTYLTESFDQ